MSGIQLPDNKNPERVAAGYKATIHNPTVSQEAKQTARQKLDQMDVDLNTRASTQHAKDTVDTLDQGEFVPDEDIGSSRTGLACDDALQRGRGPKPPPGSCVGQDTDTGIIEDPAEEYTGRSAGFHGGQEGENRSLGGYKATLKNPNTGSQAKQHAKEVLRDNDAL